MKYNLKLTIAVIIAIVSLSGCGVNNETLNFTGIREMPIFESDEIIQELIANGATGINLGLLDTARGHERIQNLIAEYLRTGFFDEADGYFGNVYLDDLNEIFLIEVHNVYPTSRNFSLHFWLNFEPILFEVLGKNTGDYYFRFEVGAMSKVEIPFRLELDIERNTTHALTAAVFSSYDENVVDNYRLRNPNHMISLHHDLTYGEFGKIHLTNSPSMPISGLKGAPIYGLSIVPIIDIPQEHIIENITFMGMPFVVQAEAGTVLDLSYFANPFVQTGDILEGYAILALLDFQPVNLNDSPYLFTQITDSSQILPHYGRMSIQLPSTPGLYDFIGIIIPNPLQRRSRLNYFPLDFSWRFTIEVIETD